MKLSFKLDSSHNRYLVYLADDHIGFVKKHPAGWNAVDSFMDKSKDFSTRKLAGHWLRNEFELAVKEGRI